MYVRVTYFKSARAKINFLLSRMIDIACKHFIRKSHQIYIYTYDAYFHLNHFRNLSRYINVTYSNKTFDRIKNSNFWLLLQCSKFAISTQNVYMFFGSLNPESYKISKHFQAALVSTSSRWNLQTCRTHYSSPDDSLEHFPQSIFIRHALFIFVSIFIYCTFRIYCFKTALFDFPTTRTCKERRFTLSENLFLNKYHRMILWYDMIWYDIMILGRMKLKAMFIQRKLIM